MMWGLEVRRLPVVELDGDVLEVSEYLLFFRIVFRRDSWRRE